MRAKIESDVALLLDIWAIASIGDRWWKRVAIRCNAVAMFAAVASVGWFIWVRKYIKCKLGDS